jgi:uncharacterized OB-fold protein
LTAPVSFATFRLAEKKFHILEQRFLRESSLREGMSSVRCGYFPEGVILMSLQPASEKKRVEIREGLFTAPLTPAEQVHLLGSQCEACGEIALGRRNTCSNCGGSKLTEKQLSRRGTLWTYTVIRHKPPGDYKGPDPFVPFGLGLIELPEGIRVMSPLHGDIDKIRIGMELKLEVYPLYTDENATEVMAFRFRPV